MHRIAEYFRPKLTELQELNLIDVKEIEVEVLLKLPLEYMLDKDLCEKLVVEEVQKRIEKIAKKHLKTDKK